MKKADSLEVIATHFAIESIALHAFETPIGEVLTGIIIFARIFTESLGQPGQRSAYEGHQRGV